MIAPADSVDFVEELRLRRWARENFCYGEARQASWHPIIHDEMRRRDLEESFGDSKPAFSESVLEDDTLCEDVLCEDVLSDDAPVPTPTDSTILTDLPDEAAAVAPRPAYTLSIGPIVPLAPDLPGLHGPHEIMPPHSRIDAPVEAPEMYYS